MRGKKRTYRYDSFRHDIRRSVLIERLFRLPLTLPAEDTNVGFRLFLVPRHHPTRQQLRNNDYSSRLSSALLRKNVEYKGKKVRPRLILHISTTKLRFALRSNVVAVKVHEKSREAALKCRAAKYAPSRGCLVEQGLLLGGRKGVRCGFQN
jgi:hypothetical protein